MTAGVPGADPASDRGTEAVYDLADLAHRYRIERDEARAALAERDATAANVRSIWARHRNATPLSLPCECIACDMGRALEAAP